MNLIYDISEDEVPIFLAETNDQLQTLDDGLVRLEKGERADDLIQSVFRAAHTLKGSAGMIGHKRMVAVTHALENTLDSVRKQLIQVTPSLIDSCLEAVDVLRLLCDEIFSGLEAQVDLDALVQSLVQASGGVITGSSPARSELAASVAVQPAPQPASGAGNSVTLTIRATIAPNSVASAARAFQLMLALQDVGEILAMTPSQEQIETSAQVHEFSAELHPNRPLEEVSAALMAISEITHLSIGASDMPLGGDVKAQPEQKNEQRPQERLQDRPQDGGEVQRVHSADKTIRTSVERLDTLMNLVGELITDRNRLYMIRGQTAGRYHGDLQFDALTETISHVGRITDQLQAEVMSIRMLPISNVFNKFPRMVRDLARRANKVTNLVIRGEDTELDRSVIEVINDPLIHLLRNAIDHGVESPQKRLAAGKTERGTILLTARHEQGRIIITVEDDGAGIDLERVKAKAVEKGLIGEKEAVALSMEEAVDLIFSPGLSTAKMVSEVSGRGVGMDIVRTNIMRLNGSITVETWPGRGSQFQIILPLTLAIVPTLLVRVGAGVYAIPLVTVTETLRMDTKEIQTINTRPVIRLRDHVLPVAPLADIFGIKSKSSANGNQYKLIVVVQAGKSQVGLIVDELIGQQEVVVKSLSAVVGDVTGISSAAILGDGQVALILDIQGLMKLVVAH
jgi:two-component system chemotaxis sensor kinase CheA